nr:hypothetical protein CFP56_34171 [Quercus suber]
MGHGLDETQFKWGAVSRLQRLHVGGLRRKLDLGSKEEDGWVEEGARPLFDVCGYGGLSVAMGFMRTTTKDLISGLRMRTREKRGR